MKFDYLLFTCDFFFVCLNRERKFIDLIIVSILDYRFHSWFKQKKENYMKKTGKTNFQKWIKVEERREKMTNFARNFQTSRSNWRHEMEDHDKMFRRVISR